MDYSVTGSPVHGLFQARILEWVTISFSRGYSWQRDQILISCVSYVSIGIWILYCWTTLEAIFISFSSVQSLSRVQLFAIPWTAAHQASLSITNSRGLLKLMSIELVMHPTILSSIVPFSSCLQSCPASECFLMSQFFSSCGQSVGVSASASVLPMNIQDWFALGLTGWISLQSKGLSSVFSNTAVQKHLAQKSKSMESFRLPVFLCFSYQSFQF